MHSPYGMEIVENCAECRLRTSAFFCNLPAELLKEFESLKYATIFPRGAMLFVEGQAPRGVFMLCSGRVKLTTLTKEALPVIRYRTGDMTRFVDEPCPCGRTFFRIARFSGRADDMLIIRGVNVFPSGVEAVVLDDPSLGSQYAIVIDRRGTLPEMAVLARSSSDAGMVSTGRMYSPAKAPDTTRPP